MREPERRSRERVSHAVARIACEAGRCSCDESDRSRNESTMRAALRQVGQHRRDVAAQEEVLGVPLLFGFQLFEEADFAAGENG